MISNTGGKTKAKAQGRILVAEDDPSVRNFIMRALQHAGHTVTVVGDGATALDALKQDSFDVLVTDIVMPRMDGLSLTSRVINDYPDLQVVLITGYGAERQKVQSTSNARSHIYSMLSKPFTLDDIQDNVNAALTKAVTKRAETVSSLVQRA